ncbi:HpcH/HpaI aldolase family protein [Martelella limonii]|uniref:HpcH/HpaI aldolase family protein n=1 Tax=Martelella limonii TaxID=1647649 RepID=UPI0015812F03|nr:aldolase/citrate lyase family protein [Martelella limonii]
MAGQRPSFHDFRRRLVAHEHMLGTFIKTPTTHATEMLGSIGFDFVVFDQEHAPLTASHLDMMILAARASNIAGIVRVPSARPDAILTVLDCGASGVLVPHVADVATAEAVVAACRYASGKRGFANTTRAGAFGSVSFEDHKRQQDDEIAVVAMIEDIDALDHIDRIVQVEGLDAIFIGRGDLTAAIGASSMSSDETMNIVDPIMQAARKVGLPIIMLCADRQDAENMAGRGASCFLTQSDHGFLRTAAIAALKEFSPPIG